LTILEIEKEILKNFSLGITKCFKYNIYNVLSHYMIKQMDVNNVLLKFNGKFNTNHQVKII